VPEADVYETTLVTTNAVIAEVHAVRSFRIGLVNVSCITILQCHSMDALRGRVFAMAGMLSESGRPIALATESGLADLTTPRFALALTGGVFLAAAIVARGRSAFGRAVEEGDKGQVG
jgi:hypothetical protein